MNNNALIKPPRLKKGDTIAIWSPSFPGGARYPGRLARGISSLENMGFKIKLSPLCCSDAGYVSAPPKDLADELHEMVIDESIRCVMASIGGWLSARILPYLDFELIQKHPKIYIGYSDVSSLLLAIYHKCNLVTFHGPALLSEMGEAHSPFEYTVNQMLQILTRPEAPKRLSPPSFWTDEFLAWEKEDVRPRASKGKAEWTGIRQGFAKGHLLGGCIPTIELLYNTAYFPSLEGSVLFLEDEEVRQDKFCAYLQAFRLKGMFDTISGLIFSRLSRPNYTLSPNISFRQIATDCLGDLNIPIAWNVDLGHTEPMLTLPLGIETQLVIKEKCVSITLEDRAVLL